MSSKFQFYEKADRKANEKITCQMWTGNKCFITRHESVYDYIDDINENVKNNVWTWVASTNPKSNPDFIFGEDYPNAESAYEALQTGIVKDSWLTMVEKSRNELLKKFPKISDLEAQAIQKNRRRRFSDDGGDLCIDRYMSNDPCMWQQMIRQPEKKAVRLFLNAALNCGNEAKQFVKNMILFSAISDIFEKAGIATEIVIGEICRFDYSGCKYYISCQVVKEANQPFDLSRLLSCGIPAYYRYYGFWFMPNMTPKFGDNGTLGYPMHSFPTEVNEALEFLECDVIVNGNGIETQATMIFEKVEHLLSK